MGFSLVKQNDDIQAYVKEYIATNEEDLDSIPLEYTYPGSTCLIAKSSKVYILTPEKEWVEL